MSILLLRMLFFFVLPRYTVSKLLPLELFHVNMNKVVWSKALLYDFIENYKHHRCLWLKTNRKYYNKRQKSKAYKQLVNLIKDEFPNADVTFVKKKIKNIRCAFRKVYKKQQESQKNQESTTCKPKLW